jgi:hypothetical protein
MTAPRTKPDTGMAHTPLSASEVVRSALIAATNEMLGECTVPQVEFFHRIQDHAPWKGFANCKGDDLTNAYELARRTVIKNRAGRVQS